MSPTLKWGVILFAGAIVTGWSLFGLALVTALFGFGGVAALAIILAKVLLYLVVPAGLVVLLVGAVLSRRTAVHP